MEKNLCSNWSPAILNICCVSMPLLLARDVESEQLGSLNEGCVQTYGTKFRLIVRFKNINEYN